MAQSARPAYTARPGEAIRVFRDDDGSFAIGVGRVRIVSEDDIDMAYVAAVVDDLGRLAHSPAGEAALRRGDAIGLPVLIAKPSPATEPANAWAIPDDLAAATLPEISLSSADGGSVQGTGTGCGSTILYDPADWPAGLPADEGASGDPAAPDRSAILLTMIEQANANAAGKANPLRPDWGVGLQP
jgi:hypothetical protein